ncbi:MAG: choice-of-anchor J domain-containing protein [Flavobacterium sp.]|nr:choice-of-anchor J domain-containing protein [Flavobacterium sp.]
MKNLKKILLIALPMLVLSSCSKDDDYKTAPFTPLLFTEDFPSGDGLDDTILELEGWTNMAETGTVVWKNQIYRGNGYAEFTSYQSSDAVSVGWLISPSIDMDEHIGEKLVFRSSQSYVSSVNNKLEVFVSSDFDGTNFSTATWTPIAAKLPTTDATYFEFMESGVIDLSSYTGNLHVGFKVTGSGTNTSLDGSYQIDNVRVYY